MTTTNRSPLTHDGNDIKCFALAPTLVELREIPESDCYQPFSEVKAFNNFVTWLNKNKQQISNVERLIEGILSSQGFRCEDCAHFQFDAFPCGAVLIEKNCYAACDYCIAAVWLRNVLATYCIANKVRCYPAHPAKRLTPQEIQALVDVVAPQKQR